MWSSHVTLCAAIGLSLLLCSSAAAVPVHYQLTLGKVDFVAEPQTATVFNCVSTGHLLCGQTFTGSFDADHALLTREGNNLRGEISNFFIQLGLPIFDQNHSFSGDPRDVFSTFRGPTRPEDENTPSFSLGAPAPGFHVHGGKLTGLYGGIVGDADATFIDLEIATGVGPGRYGALFFRNIVNGIPSDFALVRGSFSVSPVPEPSTLILVLLGILAGAARYPRR